MARTNSSFVLRRHAAPLMAMYAEAVEWAVSHGSIDTRTPGHIAVEPRQRGGRYAYWIRYDVRGRPGKEYLGPEGGDRHLEAVAVVEGLKRIALQAKNLRKLGFEAVEHEAALVIAELCNAGLFAGGAVLVGTRAFGSLLNHLGYRTIPFLATQDVDIARLDPVKLAAPLPEGGFGELLGRTGLRFSPVLGLERPPGPPTSYKVIGRDLKVDLLVPAPPSATPYATRAVSELGAHGTALPFLDYLLSESWQTIVIGRDHLLPVRTPQPARYCLHKLVVADIRSGMDNPKVAKDVLQAGILAAILAEEDPTSLEGAATALAPTMLKHARRTLPRLEKVLGPAYPAAFDLVRRLLVLPG